MNFKAQTKFSLKWKIGDTSRISIMKCDRFPGMFHLEECVTLAELVCFDLFLKKLNNFSKIQRKYANACSKT